MGKYENDTWSVVHKGTEVEYTTSRNNESSKVYLTLEYRGVPISRQLEEEYTNLEIEVTKILNEIDSSKA